jgi:hypothetical protein
MLSRMDDYPVHQIAEPIRFAATSDRNFYDRYYFNVHSCSSDIFMVMGMGQYPNLAVQDAFALVLRGRKHRVVRASKGLGDRSDTSVGPIRIEVVEGLKKVRFIIEPNEHGIECDLLWEGAIPAYQEPRMFIRRHGRVLFDTARFAQNGYWSGTLRVGGETLRVTPDRWWGARDRSWGVRPVGEVEHPGIRHAELALDGMWNYVPMQFKDYSILCICLERDSGERELEEAVRIWNDPSRKPELLGRTEHHHVVPPGPGLMSLIESSVLSFPEAPGGRLDIKVTPLLNCHVGIGTGYGFDMDWRHGMYQGPLVVQGVELDTIDDAGKLWGLVESCSRFETGSDVGYGMNEYGFFGPFRKYGLT